MKVLVYDIETSPNLAYCWGLWQQNIGPKSGQLVQSTSMLCFGAKWHEERGRVQVHRGEGMVAAAHALFDEADVVVGWNNKKFDDKHMAREFLEYGLKPPSPYKSIDLMQVVRSKFKFQSNSLEYVSQRLLGKGKVETGGFDLWLGVMRDDPKAWAQMERYQVGDVRRTDELYTVLKPWITGHPSVPLADGYADLLACNNCGSTRVQKRGYQRTGVSQFHQYQCQGCGHWFRGATRVGTSTQGRG